MIAYYLSHHLTHLDHTFSWHTTLYCKRLVIIMILNIRYHHFFQKYICHRIPFPLCRISLVMSLTFITYHTLPQFGPLVKIAKLFDYDELLKHEFSDSKRLNLCRYIYLFLICCKCQGKLLGSNEDIEMNRFQTFADCIWFREGSSLLSNLNICQS